MKLNVIQVIKKKYLDWTWEMSYAINTENMPRLHLGTLILLYIFIKPLKPSPFSNSNHINDHSKDGFTGKNLSLL